MSRRHQRVMKGKFRIGIALLALLPSIGTSSATDSPGTTSSKAQRIYDWSGFYVGAHFGYGLGRADWTAQNTASAGPLLAGSLDLESRAGGLVGGLQAGYNEVLPSRMLVGIETDLSFPNYLN